MNEYYQPGLRLFFGRGDKAFHGGLIDDVPSLIVSDMGEGVVGGKVDFKGKLPSGREWCAFIFENIESVDVAIEELQNVRKLYSDPEYMEYVASLANTGDTEGHTDG